MIQPSPPNEPPLITPYVYRVLIAVGIGAGMLLLLVFLWYALYVLLLLFAGILLATLLRGMADGVGRLAKLGSGASLAATLILLLLVLVAGTWLAAPAIAEQASLLWEQVPRALESLRQRLGHYAWGRWLLGMGFGGGALTPRGPELMSQATGVVSTTVGALFSIVIVLFAGFYLAAHPSLYTKGLLRLVPLRHRPRGAEVLGAVGYTLRWWLVGQLLTMTVVGVMTAVGLWLLGIPLAFALGVLAFLLDFIPNFGPVIAAAPAVLLALMISPTMALYVILLYTIVQQIESLIISPLVHQKTVHLPPVLTITAQVLLAILAGPLGLLLATPLVAVALVLTKMLYVEQVLHDEVDSPDEHITEKDKPPLPEPNRPPSRAQPEERPDQTPPPT